MTKLTLIVTMEVQGDVDEMAGIVEDYLTNHTGPFREDFAPPTNDDRVRSDGYEGPFVMGVAVRRDDSITAWQTNTEENA